MFIYWIKVTEYGEVKKLSICQFKIYVMKILLAFNGVRANGGRKRVSWCCSTVFIRRKSVPMFCDDLYSAGFRRCLTKYFYHVIGQIHCQPLASRLLSSQGLQSSHAVTPVLHLWWLDMEQGSCGYPCSSKDENERQSLLFFLLFLVQEVVMQHN